jgi:outer membrane protein
MGIKNQLCRLALMTVLLLIIFPLISLAAENTETPVVMFDQKSRLTLDQCITLALKNNRQRSVSKTAVTIAEAQHQQALSAYWPQINARYYISKLKDDPNLIIPGQTIDASSAMSSASPTVIQIPEQDVKLMNRDSQVSNLELIYPIYMGGKRNAIKEQSKLGIRAAQLSDQRTDLQVTAEIKKYYFASILAARLLAIGEEHMDRFKSAMELTEYLYKHGGGRVKETDNLRIKVVFAGIRSAVEELRSNEELSKAALVNYMGLEWNSDFELADTKIPFSSNREGLEKLVTDAYRSNYDWRMLEVVIQAGSAKIKEAQSGHLPTVAFIANLSHIENSYNKGLMTDKNRDPWSVAVGIELPIFKGFHTVNAKREAEARLNQLEDQKILLKGGIALQVKDVYLKMRRAAAQVDAMTEAVQTAFENRHLINRAYSEELADTQEVIEAQLLESVINAQYNKALYDHAAGELELAFILGTSIQNILQ